MKRKTIILIIAAISLLAIVYLVFGRSKVTAGDIKIETARVEKGTISKLVESTGTLQALDTVQVGTQVSGIVNKIYVDFNSPVKKGQLIATIDTINLVAALEQSKAKLDNAKAELEYQQANYNRLAPLIDKNLVAQSDFDQVIYSLNVAKANYNSALASHKMNKINLEYAFIHSPIDGVVIRRDVQEGQTVAASFNTPTLFVIAKDMTQMQVVADVDEADIGQVKEGQRVEFKVDAYPNDKFEGQITQIRLNPSISNNVVTYTVIIDAQNPENKLMPGMTATIDIYVQEEKDLLVIPSKSVRFSMDEKLLSAYMNQIGKPMEKPGGMPEMGSMPPAGAMPGANAATITENQKTKTIWVKKNSVILPVLVETGLDDDIQVQILSGLNLGDEVILSMEEQKVQTVKKQASNPFMPQPPGRNRNNSKSSGTPPSGK